MVRGEAGKNQQNDDLRFLAIFNDIFMFFSGTLHWVRSWFLGVKIRFLVVIFRKYTLFSVFSIFLTFCWVIGTLRVKEFLCSSFLVYVFLLVFCLHHVYYFHITWEMMHRCWWWFYVFKFMVWIHSDYKMHCESLVIVGDFVMNSLLLFLLLNYLKELNKFVVKNPLIPKLLRL